MKNTTRGRYMQDHALTVFETSLGNAHPSVATVLNDLAQLLLQATNGAGETKPLIRRARAILLAFQRDTGHTHPGRDPILANYRSLLQEMRKGRREIGAAVPHWRRPVRARSDAADAVWPALGSRCATWRRRRRDRMRRRC